MAVTFDIAKYKVASYSFLKGLNNTTGNPAKLIHGRNSRGQDSDAQRMGRAIDTAILQPDKFDKRFRVLNSIPNTESSKYRYCELFCYATAKGASRAGAIRFAKRYSGHRFSTTILDKKTGWENEEFAPEINYILSKGAFTPLSFSEYDRVMWSAESARNYAPFIDYLESGTPQPQLSWTNKVAGIECRGEPDLMEFGSFILDIKTARTSAPKVFAGRWGDMRKMYYLEQLAAYWEGTGADPDTELFILAVEKEAPFACSMIKISDMDREQARWNFWEWCTYFKHISDNNLWDMGYEYFVKYEARIEPNSEGQPRGRVDSVSFDGIFETDIYQ